MKKGDKIIFKTDVKSNYPISGKGLVLITFKKGEIATVLESSKSGVRISNKTTKEAAALNGVWVNKSYLKLVFLLSYRDVVSIKNKLKAIQNKYGK